MKFDNIRKHPDFIEVLDNMDHMAKVYERNMKIASVLVTAGGLLLCAGLILAGAQEQILRSAK